MASWIIHLRIADTLLSHLSNICETEFVVGNLAPDSGIPNKDWSEFSPSTVISHFKFPDETGHKSINIDQYIDSYFTKKLQTSYTNKQYSFFLGYLAHLLTDILWVRNVFPLCITKSPEEYKADPKGTVWTWKKDFFDLDTLYLRNNPDFRAYKIYKDAVGFKNEYLDIFAHDAFDQKRIYITSFYDLQKEGLEREYFYLKENEATGFVNFAADEIEKKMREHCHPRLITNKE